MLARILIVDDDSEVRSLLRDYLKAKHHQIFEASDGAQGFMMAEKEVPHLIIMDVVMPGVYGTTAVRRLHDYWRTSKIPIIIMSGTAEESLLPILKDNNKLRFMRKPFSISLLDQLMRELLPEGGYTP